MDMRVGAFSMKQSGMPRNQKHDSWMAVAHRLYKFQTELVFYRLIGDGRVKYVGRDPCHVQAGESFSYESVREGGVAWAVCQEIMTKGRHYVEFTATREGVIDAGIVRPIDDWEDSENICSFPFWNYEHDRCLRSYLKYCRLKQRSDTPGFGGNRHHFFLNYYGASPIQCQQGDVVGMLLDLDEGYLLATRNGTLLRAARAQERRAGGALLSDVSGHYCWAFSAPWGSYDTTVADCGLPGVRVKRLPVPSSVMGEERM